jgi:molybdate transport system substrate-binding protein
MAIQLLSGGAAQGLLGKLSAEIRAATGQDVAGEFSAVGAMKQKLLAGAPADVIILSRAMIKDLATAGAVEPGTVRDIGKVETSVAIRTGDGKPSLATSRDLATALELADAIYFPDPVQATAGVHFASVIERLGLKEDLAPVLRLHPNGMTAMKALAAHQGAAPLGCTQTTEILATPGVTLIGPLPPPFGLATVYTAALVKGAAQREAGLALIELLTGPQTVILRRQLGFIAAD